MTDGSNDHLPTAESERDLEIQSTEEWKDLFPFEPYSQQIDGIEHARSVCRSGGYLLLEGACGTGKTLIALVAAIQSIREEEAERVMAVTSVKQQLRQFITEVRAINEHPAQDESPYPGIVMVGKRDMLPYARNGQLAELFDMGVHDGESELQETTRDLISRSSMYELDVEPGDLDGRISACDERECDRLSYGSHLCPAHRPTDDEEDWYDPVRAKALCQLVADLSGPRLETAGVKAPYPETPPHTRDVLAYSEGDAEPTDENGLFDPFYARFFADEEWIPFSFDEDENHVLDSETIVEAAVSRGTCPHEAMASLMGEAAVLIGNYNHAFDPMTRLLTEEKAEVLDDETLLVVDEAHMLEERVRDLLSESVGLHTFRTARQDFVLAREYLAGTGGGPNDDAAAHQREARESLASTDVTEQELEIGQRFIVWLIEQIDEEVRSFLEREFDDWQQHFRADELPTRDQNVPLRDPETVEIDRLTPKADERWGRDVWRRMRSICAAVSDIHENDSQTDRSPVAAGVGTFLNNWDVLDEATYFREIEMEFSEKPTVDTTLPNWVEAYNARLSLFNCIPREPLAEIFDELAGGVLMSATLEPFSVYKRVSGLELLAGAESEGDEKDARPVETTSYGLAFPEEHRESWIVDLPPFTYRNRGPPETEYGEMTGTRQAYASAMRTVAESPGNVLLCLPSYAEAEWAVTYLRERGIEKPVLRDRSTDSRETDEMLGRFFQRDSTDRVLITSARGTVTEGIDYKGDRLHTAAVVGVPYANVSHARMKAVMCAYDREMGDGFEYAVKVPAVRKARQALGRVLRGHEEVGTRLLLDQRYGVGVPRSVHGYLSESEKAEFTTVSPDMLDFALDRFWSE